MGFPLVKLHPIADLYGGPAVALGFLLFFWLEGRWPLRQRTQSRWSRLLTNGMVVAASAVAFRLALIPAVVWVAYRAEQAQFGLVRWLALPSLLQGVLAFLLLDYTIYIWHWLMHRVPFLWRFHLVHHTDLDLDVATALRFHFGEMLLSVCYRSVQVALIGAGPVMALAYEFTMEGATEFQHSNWRLPFNAERALNWVIVTPRMHGIHHSIVERETNANWSVLFSWWDRLHGTARGEGMKLKW